ncbi:MAG: DegV family protein [Clostridia bacterium]|nr:DegV family protein [Clostridia bacterium]
MKYKIVSDSSSNIFTWDAIPYATVPIKILSTKKEYVDNEQLDVAQMVEDLKTVKGATKTACPGTGEWIEAFDGAECVFAITLTSNLSGCYNSACVARDQYMEENPGCKVYVIDSLSTGGEMQLIIEKLTELILLGKEFEEIVTEIEEYKDTTRLLFSLQSLTNLARNGRVSPAVATIAGVLGIRVVGSATEGVLDPTDKVRGEKRAIATLFANMKKLGYKGGKVRINHCFNIESASALSEKIFAEFPSADVKIIPCTALCSFYAEEGGLIIGYEGAKKH